MSQATVQAQFAHPEVVVTTQWVADHLNDPKVRIVEVDEDPTQYDQGHIAGALTFNWKNDFQDPVRRDFVSKTAFERRVSQAGIGNDTTVVLYGDKNNWFATYTFWLFKYYGHRDVRVMDGGRAKWLAENRATTTEKPKVTPTTYRAKDPDNTIRAFRVQVEEALKKKEHALVDVRSPQEYSGELIAMPAYPQEGAQRAGHIPGAASIPWAQAVREDGTFKSPSDLRALYTGKGVTPDKKVIAYCRIGERSSHTWFVLKYLLGFKDVRNYDGSWTEWGSVVNAPIENPRAAAPS